MELVRKYEVEAGHLVDELSKIDPSADKYGTMADNASKLVKNIVDLKKAEAEIMKAEYEHAEKQEALKHEKDVAAVCNKDQKVKNGIAVAGIVVPVLSAIGISVYSWKREDVGVMTYTAGKKATDFLLRFFRK